MNSTVSRRSMPAWFTDLDAGSYPVLLPHVTCVGQDLYLGSRKLDRLTPGQARFLAGCSGVRTFAEILREQSLVPADIIHLTRYLLWWSVPIGWPAALTEPCERLVLCTQPQPTMLAMGGRIMHEAAGIKTTLLGCFNPAAEMADLRIYRNTEEYRLGCLDESFLLSRLAGIAVTDWNISLNGRREDVNAGGVSPSAGGENPGGVIRSAGGDHFERLVHDFVAKEEPAEIFIPAALGGSRTALLIRDTVLKLFAEGYIQSEVHLYADEPSVLGHRLIDEFESYFEDSYLSVTPYTVTRSDAWYFRGNIADLFRCGTTADQKRKWANHKERYWQLGFTQFI